MMKNRAVPVLISVLSAGSAVGVFAQANPFGVSESGLEYASGQALFEKVWVSAPASTRASDGLGPLYNARSCAQCHIEAGRGSPDNSLIFRLQHEVYGEQLQNRAVRGLQAEPQMQISYSVREVSLADGTSVSLRQPYYDSSAAGENLAVSPRLAPSLAGSGLLDTIPLHEILRAEDADDANRDGISGRAGSGRFGWKAEVGSLAQQVALAFKLDMGISTEMFSNPFGDCTVNQHSCLTLPNGASREDDNLEISRRAFATLMFFVGNIPAPAQAEHDQQNRDGRGSELFQSAGCAMCHQGAFLDGRLNPYSDLLLHDMGEGLADAMNNELSAEWRTAPLWGMSEYSRQEEQYYLHDGRATTLEEAIMWHGGEGLQARNAYAALGRPEREDLINFLQSL